MTMHDVKQTLTYMQHWRLQLSTTILSTYVLSTFSSIKFTCTHECIMLLSNYNVLYSDTPNQIYPPGTSYLHADKGEVSLMQAIHLVKSEWTDYKKTVSLQHNIQLNFHTASLTNALIACAKYTTSSRHTIYRRKTISVYNNVQPLLILATHVPKHTPSQQNYLHRKLECLLKQNSYSQFTRATYL